jgi:hypothetical protein
MLRVYVASSWRNEYQPDVVKYLRTIEGVVVYDFKDPETSKSFHWSQIDQEWKKWGFQEYMMALDHPLAVSGFKSDMGALEWCDVCVLVLPCGKSAHLELGWAAGRGKRTAIYYPPDVPMDPELMSNMATGHFDNLPTLSCWLGELVGEESEFYGKTGIKEAEDDYGKPR